MSKVHVYLLPFADDAGSSYASAWTEVTKDVIELGDFSSQLDNTEYDVGILRTANVKLTLANERGYYNDVGDAFTIFKYTRTNTQVRITWEPGDKPLICGFFKCGAGDAILSEEITLFQGLLSDLGTESDIDALSVDFQVLGYESLMDNMALPTLSVSDTIATSIYKCLNQSKLNTLVTVSAANISTSTSVVPDDFSSLTNKTVKDAMQDLLLAGNCVLFIKGTTLYVQPRTANAGLAYSFYGQGSLAGIENIVNIQKFRTGVNKVLNFWTWQSTVISGSLTVLSQNATAISKDASSVLQYGALHKEISIPYFTDSTKQQSILDNLRTEFAVKKREFELVTAINPTVAALNLLDQISVDYPVVGLQDGQSDPVAIYGQGQYGVNYYPTNINVVTIDSSSRFKIMGKKFSFKDETFTFYMREV